MEKEKRGEEGTLVGRRRNCVCCLSKNWGSLLICGRVSNPAATTVLGIRTGLDHCQEAQDEEDQS